MEIQDIAKELKKALCSLHLEEISKIGRATDDWREFHRILRGIAGLPEPEPTKEPSLFSGMSAEEIQEVAARLHGDDALEYSRHEKKLLILIANLAAIMKDHIEKYHRDIAFSAEQIAIKLAEINRRIDEASSL